MLYLIGIHVGMGTLPRIRGLEKMADRTVSANRVPNCHNKAQLHSGKFHYTTVYERLNYLLNIPVLPIPWSYNRKVYILYECMDPIQF